MTWKEALAEIAGFLWEECFQNTICTLSDPGNICTSVMGGCRTDTVGFAGKHALGELKLIRREDMTLGASYQAAMKSFPDSSYEITQTVLLRHAGPHATLGVTDGASITYLDGPVTKDKMDRLRAHIHHGVWMRGVIAYEKDGVAWCCEFEVVAKP